MSGSTIQRPIECGIRRNQIAIMWSTGVEIMEWTWWTSGTTEGKIHDGNKDMLDTYWTHFEEYIHPQNNKLIAVVELK